MWVTYIIAALVDILCLYYPVFRYVIVFIAPQHILGTHKLATKMESIISGTSDFIYFWGAGRVIDSGNVNKLSNYVYYNNVIKHYCGRVLSPGHWAYPPTYDFIVCLFGIMPIMWAYAIWTISTLVFGFYTFYKLFRKKILAAVLIFSPVSFVNIHYGQNGLFMSCLLLMGFYCYYRTPLPPVNGRMSYFRNLIRNNEIASGMFFGLATIKFPFVVLVPFFFLIYRSWKAILSMGMTTVILILMSVFCFGIQAWIDNITIASPNMTNNLFNAWHALRYQEMYVSPFIIARMFNVNIIWSFIFQVLVSITCIVIMYLITKAPDEKGTQYISWGNIKKMTAIMPLMIIASPYAHIYDLVFISPAIIVCIIQLYKYKMISLYPIMALIWFIIGTSEYIIAIHTKATQYLPIINVGLCLFMSIAVYCIDYMYKITLTNKHENVK